MGLKPEQTVAEGVRVEVNSETGDVYVVFRVVDPQFKQEVLTNWSQDLPLKVKGKNLVKT